MEDNYQSRKHYFKAIQQLSTRIHRKNNIKLPTASQSSKDLNNLNTNIGKYTHISSQNKLKQSEKYDKVLEKARKRNLSLEGYQEYDTINENHKQNTSLADIKSVKTWNSKDLPYSPAFVIKNFASSLTFFEQREILTFRSIYYIAGKVKKFESNSSLANNGFDDDRSDYILIKNDHLGYRYEILEILGRGSYGQVVKSIDHKDHSLKAIKILRSLPQIQQQGKIEILILETLSKYEQDSEYLITLHEHFSFRGHICLVFELLSLNLYQYQKSRYPKAIPNTILKSFADQVLKGIQFFHNLSIIHSDLKPENIMLNLPSMNFKIIDFGSGCYKANRIFSYIQSRFYRSPEVIFEIGYNEKIDIWSFGCVLAELVIMKPLFMGKDEIDQVLCMIEVLGLPPAHMIEKSPKRKLIREAVKKTGKGFRLPIRPLKMVIVDDPPLLDLVSSKV